MRVYEAVGGTISSLGHIKSTAECMFIQIFGALKHAEFTHPKMKTAAAHVKILLKDKASK
jgi:hypothetical protein